LVQAREHHDTFGRTTRSVVRQSSRPAINTAKRTVIGVAFWPKRDRESGAMRLAGGTRALSLRTEALLPGDHSDDRAAFGNGMFVSATKAGAWLR